MRRASWIVLIAVGFCTACTTHEKKFERNLPPPPSRRAADAAHAAEAATNLIRLYRGKVIALPPEALAPLAQAAAILFETTGAPGMKSASRAFADTLLDARVRVGSGEAFFSSKHQNRPDPGTTIDAGSSLIDVFRATRDPRYFSAVQSTARAVMSDRLGWGRTRRGFALRVPGTRRLYSVVLTADAALFLGRARNIHAVLDPTTSAASAFHFVTVNQAAVGRWYLNIGAKTPMNLATWARTLLALASTRSPEHQGIVGGGALALWSAGFKDSGEALQTPLADAEGFGVPFSLRLLQRYAGTTRDADLAYGNVLGHLRPDGTVEAVRPTNSAVQAYYALAFAERTYALQRPSAWEHRLI